MAKCKKQKKVDNFKAKKVGTGGQKINYTQTADMIKYNKTRRFRYKCKKKERVLTHKWNFEDLVERNGPDPVCYLSGEPIDYEATADYHLDHILPRNKGGDNSIENCGLATRTANQMKAHMTVDEFLKECKKILEYNGYHVTRKKENK